MDVEELGWVKASDYRQEVLKALQGNPKTPKDLAEDTDYYLSHISKTLKELAEHNLVECLTPDRKKGRLYQATEEGQEIIQLLD